MIPAALVALHALFSFAYLWETPLWEAPEEVEHLRYLGYLNEFGMLPAKGCAGRWPSPRRSVCCSWPWSSATSGL